MIKITDRFYINATSKCYTLTEKIKITDKDSKNFGKEVLKELGYYTTLEGCLDGIIKTELREFIGKKEENSISDLKQEQQSLQDFIKSLKKILTTRG